MLKQKLSDGVRSVRNMFARRSVAEYFVLFVAASLGVYLVYYAIVGQGNFVDIFFNRSSDLFMDFFNSVRDAAQGPGVYTERHVIYPPMANLIYLFLSRFIEGSYPDTPFSERQAWVEYPEAVLLIALFTMICAILFFFLVYETVKGKRSTRALFAFFAVINVPLLYMLERGNMMLLCLIALLVYFATYNSENKIYREIGLLALAFSFSLKLYPVIFGWFLLADKRFFAGLRCFIYGMLMLFIPSFWFGGPACFVQIFKNITSFSTGHTNAVTVISSYSGISSGVLSLAVYLWCLICVLAFVLSPFIYKEKWKCWMLGVVAIMTVPSLTSVYMWSFFIIPLIVLSNTEKLKRSNLFYFAVIIAIFLFTLTRFNRFLTINSFLIFPVTAIISVVAVVDTAVHGIKRLRENKTKALT